MAARHASPRSYPGHYRWWGSGVARERGCVPGRGRDGSGGGRVRDGVGRGDRHRRLAAGPGGGDRVLAPGAPAAGLRAAVLAAAVCALSCWRRGSAWPGSPWRPSSYSPLGGSLTFNLNRSWFLLSAPRPLSEVEEPELCRFVRKLCRDARLLLSPAMQPNILTVGCSLRSAPVCCTEGLLRALSQDELRAVLAHELCAGVPP